MEEIYNGLYQVLDGLVEIENELMAAAICNQTGKIQFIVQLMHNKEGEFAAFFHKDIREYQQRIKAEEYILEMAETEEDMDEIEGLRKGIQIIFVPLQFIPESQKNNLRELGITRKKKKLYPLILSLNDSKLLTRNVKDSELTLCKKVINWLIQEGNLALLASTPKKIKKNTLPKIIYNQNTKKSIYEKGEIIEFEDEISYEEFIGYKGEKPKLYIPEFSIFRLKKNIRLTVPVTFEIRLMLSPTHFYGNEEKLGPQYVLVIASDEEIIMIEELEELDPRQIQNILIELYIELQFIPVQWVTRGIFAPFLKDSLDPIMNIFKLDFYIGTEESIIDTYSFEHLYHLMTSDSPFLDFDEFEEFDDYSLTNDIQESSIVSTEDSIVDVELEAFQRSLPFAIEFMEKNPHSSLKELEKYLLKKKIDTKIIFAIVHVLSEVDQRF